MRNDKDKNPEDKTSPADEGADDVLEPTEGTSNLINADLSDYTEQEYSRPNPTGAIKLSDYDVASADYYVEEQSNKPRTSGRFKLIVAIVSFLVLGAAIGTTWAVVYNNAQPDKSYISPESDKPDVLDKGEATPDQMVEAVITDTTDVLAIHLAEQYGNDALGEMQLATGIESKDGDGKDANVRIATIFNVPTDFDIKGSQDYFKDAMDAFEGKWKYEKRTDVPEGYKMLESIRMWDTVEDPSNPVVVTINYFQLDEDETYTITVETAIYS